MGDLSNIELPDPNQQFLQIVEKLADDGRGIDAPDYIRADTAYQIFIKTNDATELASIYRELVLDSLESEDSIEERLEAKYRRIFPGFTLEKLEKSRLMMFEFSDYLLHRFYSKLLFAGAEGIEYADFCVIREELFFFIENELISLPVVFNKVRGFCKDSEGNTKEVQCSYDAYRNELQLDLI